MNIQLAAICFLIGAGIVFMFLSLLGIARFPDFFTRLHAQGVGDTLGAFLILAGMMVAARANLMSLKLLLIFVVIVLTNPLGTNLMMIAAVNKEDYQGYSTLLYGGQESDSDTQETKNPESDDVSTQKEPENECKTAPNCEEQSDHQEKRDQQESGEDTDAAPAKSNTKKKKSRRKRKPSMSMNKSELIAAAEKRGITVPEGATKREILSLIYPDKEL